MSGIRFRLNGVETDVDAVTFMVRTAGEVRMFD